MNDTLPQDTPKSKPKDKKCCYCGQKQLATSAFFPADDRYESGLRSMCLICHKVLGIPYRRPLCSGQTKSQTVQRNRRARKMGSQGTHTTADVNTQYERQNKKCYYCHKILTKYHVDHFVPLSRGGSNGPENIVIACPTCNTSKGCKLISEWGGPYTIYS